MKCKRCEEDFIEVVVDTPLIDRLKLLDCSDYCKECLEHLEYTFDRLVKSFKEKGDTVFEVIV